MAKSNIFEHLYFEICFQELLPINGRSTTERESSEIEIGRSPDDLELRTLSPEEDIYNAAMDDERDELGGI